MHKYNKKIIQMDVVQEQIATDASVMDLQDAL